MISRSEVMCQQFTSDVINLEIYSIISLDVCMKFYFRIDKYLHRSVSLPSKLIYICEKYPKTCNSHWNNMYFRLFQITWSYSNTYAILDNREMSRSYWKHSLSFCQTQIHYLLVFLNLILILKYQHFIIFKICLDLSSQFDRFHLPSSID